MKALYKLVITPKTGVRTLNGAVAPVVIEFRGTTWQAKFVMPAKSKTGHKVNSCKLGGAEHGL